MAVKKEKHIITEKYYGETGKVGDEGNALCFLEHPGYLEIKILLCSI